MSCDLPFPNPVWSFGIDIAGQCSGQGECVNSFCVCKEGWTGLSDWVNSEGFDCQVNVLVFQLLWAGLLAFQVISIFVSIPYLRTRYDSYQQIKAIKSEKGEAYSLKENRGATGMVLWYGIGAPCVIIMCLLKIFKTDERIGVTWAASIMYSLTRIVFYLCYVLFQPSLLEAIMKGSKKANGVVVWNAHISYVFFFIQFTIAFFPFVAIAKPEYQQEMYLVSTFLVSLTGIWIALQAHHVTRKLTKTLDQSYEMAKQEKTLLMKKKLQAMQAVPMKQGPLLAALFFTMFLWPFLWNKHDYIVPFTWITFVHTGLRTAQTSISAEESRSIEASSGGSNKTPSSGDTGPRGAGISSELATSFAHRKEVFTPDSVVETDESYV